MLEVGRGLQPGLTVYGQHDNESCNTVAQAGRDRAYNRGCGSALCKPPLMRIRKPDASLSLYPSKAR